eukprot:5602741-Pyramimonas_sp.AAC.1
MPVPLPHLSSNNDSKVIAGRPRMTQTLAHSALCIVRLERDGGAGEVLALTRVCRWSCGRRGVYEWGLVGRKG